MEAPPPPPSSTSPTGWPRTLRDISTWPISATTACGVSAPTASSPPRPATATEAHPATAEPPTEPTCSPPAIRRGSSRYIADTGTQRGRQVRPTGVIQTLAGTGVAGSAADNVLASTATLNSPMGVALDAAGDIVIADTYNQRIRQVDADGRIHNLVGTGVGRVGAEGMPPAQTPLNGPSGVCIDRGGT